MGPGLANCSEHPPYMLTLAQSIILFLKVTEGLKGKQGHGEDITRVVTHQLLSLRQAMAGWTSRTGFPSQAPPWALSCWVVWDAL